MLIMQNQLFYFFFKAKDVNNQDRDDETTKIS